MTTTDPVARANPSRPDSPRRRTAGRIRPLALTALVASARDVGSRLVVDGFEALVRQGAASFQLWTGVEPPVDVMRAALGLEP